MKNQLIKTFTVSTLMVFFSLTLFGQDWASKPNMDSSSIEKDSIPKTVKDAFIKQYPAATNENWTSFPANGYSNDWYNDSYSSKASGIPSIHKYYVVDYTNDKVSQKSIYLNDGSKVATHCALKQSVPKPISDAISKGVYKTWSMEGKEEIFQDKQTDSMKVYKVEVVLKNEQHLLYYQEDGKLLKDIKVS